LWFWADPPSLRFGGQAGEKRHRYVASTKNEVLMFTELEEINSRPEPFQYYTAEELWTDEHTSKQMLEFHLNEFIDASSRNKKYIYRSVNWITLNFGVDHTTSICDFGCGPGLYTTRIAEQGAKVTGIDFSKRSIEYAKKVAQEKGSLILMEFEEKLGQEQFFDFLRLILKGKVTNTNEFLDLVEKGLSKDINLWFENKLKT